LNSTSNGVNPAPTAWFYADSLIAWVSWKSVYPDRRAAQAEALDAFEASFIRLRQERNRLMTENILEKLFEHNNWANLHLIQACSALSDDLPFLMSEGVQLCE
jgi:hypothetical protein